MRADIAFCGQAVLRALLDQGFPARALCQDELSERLLAPLAEGALPAQRVVGEDPVTAPAPRRMELVRGTVAARPGQLPDGGPLRIKE